MRSLVMARPDDQLAAVTAPTTHLPFAGSPPREGAMAKSPLPSIYAVYDNAVVLEKLKTWRAQNGYLDSRAVQDPWEYVREHREGDGTAICLNKGSKCAGTLWLKGRYRGNLRDGWLKTNQTQSFSRSSVEQACRKEDEWSANWSPVVISLEQPEDNDKSECERCCDTLAIFGPEVCKESQRPWLAHKSRLYLQPQTKQLVHSDPAFSKSAPIQSPLAHAPPKSMPAPAAAVIETSGAASQQTPATWHSSPRLASQSVPWSTLQPPPPSWPAAPPPPPRLPAPGPPDGPPPAGPPPAWLPPAGAPPPPQAPLPLPPPSHQRLGQQEVAPLEQRQQWPAGSPPQEPEWQQAWRKPSGSWDERSWSWDGNKTPWPKRLQPSVAEGRLAWEGDDHGAAGHADDTKRKNGKRRGGWGQEAMRRVQIVSRDEAQRMRRRECGCPKCGHMFRQSPTRGRDDASFKSEPWQYPARASAERVRSHSRAASRRDD